MPKFHFCKLCVFLKRTLDNLTLPKACSVHHSSVETANFSCQLQVTACTRLCILAIHYETLCAIIIYETLHTMDSIRMGTLWSWEINHNLMGHLGCLSCMHFGPCLVSILHTVSQFLLLSFSLWERSCSGENIRPLTTLLLLLYCKGLNSLGVGAAVSKGMGKWKKYPHVWTIIQFFHDLQ